MIERFYLKNTLGFKNIEIRLKGGLVVITGPSGAGKSVFINSILGLFGIKEFEGESAEATLMLHLKLDEFGIENDEEFVIFKLIKNDRIRYFINNQQISKKNLKEITTQKIRYISHKDYSDFNQNSLLSLLDNLIVSEKKEFKKELESYSILYENYLNLKKKIAKIEEDEQKVEELKEFCKLQIEKIEAISPKIGELEELMEYKKRLSKAEKIRESIEKITPIFEIEEEVYRLYSYFEKDEKLFSEAFSELRDMIERAEGFLEESAHQEIESILDRIEKLSSLVKRFGSIEEALSFKKEKELELARYENISFEKKSLEKEFEKIKNKITQLADSINKDRSNYVARLNRELNSILKELRIDGCLLNFSSDEIDETCGAKVEFNLKGAGLEKISSGEFNRIRVAILSLRAKYEGEVGILILDEIDSNLSGEESKAVAKLLKELSKNYQIVVISHQPHLPSLADQHLLIEKSGNQSVIRELEDVEERAYEIARMISGEERTKEAIEFAREVLG